MRFAIVTTEYPDFLTWLYDQEPEKRFAPYPEQLRFRYASLFGGADFQTKALKALGQEAIDLFANNYWLQAAWGREASGVSSLRRTRQAISSWSHPWMGRIQHRMTPSGRRLSPGYLSNRWIYKALDAQIAAFQPDVLINQALDTISPDFISAIRPSVDLLIAWHSATPLPSDVGLSKYDLGMSSFPATLDSFERAGVPSVLTRLAFDPSVLKSVRPGNRDLEVTFVGSFHPVHSSRTAFLEELCKRIPQLQIWGPSLERVARSSILWSRYRGQAWGRDMYDIMGRSRITLNHHGNVAPYANNSRLFEATGLGALLITDRHPNLEEIFDVGTEVLAYSDLEECVTLIQEHLEDETKREAIATRAFNRTIRDYNYQEMLIPLVGFAQHHLRSSD